MRDWKTNKRDKNEHGKVKSEDLVDRRYRLGEEIGQGGLGTVYRAFDETLERHHY